MLDDSGGVVGFSSHHLTPADNLQVSIPPDQRYARTLTDGREVVELLIQAMAMTAGLLTSTGALPPPPVFWQVRSTGLVYLDQAEAAQAAREASSSFKLG